MSASPCAAAQLAAQQSKTNQQAAQQAAPSINFKESTFQDLADARFRL
jgi:hypothetical protein